MALTGNLVSDFQNSAGSDKLQDIFDVLNGKYVVLDLAQCTGNILDSTNVSGRTNQDKIVSVILPDSVTFIGEKAFVNSPPENQGRLTNSAVL